MSTETEIRDLQEAGARLAQMHEDVRVIEEINEELLEASATLTAESLDRTLPGAARADEVPTQGRRKRRKLDEKPLAKRPRIEYGYHGQSVATKLRMEILSSDGGTLASPGHGLSDNAYAADNILLDDESVYCTQGKHCNIIIRHQGETPFSLERLVIKGPKEKFTHP